MDKRSLLAIVLCMAIFFLWTSVVMPRLFPAPPPATTSAPATTSPSTPPSTPTPAPTPEPLKVRASYPESPPFELRSKFLKVRMSPKGAGVLGLTITDPQLKGEVTLLRDFDARHPHFALRRVGGVEPIESLFWEVVERSEKKAEFRYRLADGLEITKAFALDPDRHTLKLTVLLDNKSAPPEGKKDPADLSATLELLAFNGLDPDSGYRFDQYLAGVWKYDGKIHFKPLADVEKGESKRASALAIQDPKARAEEVRSVEEEYLRETKGRKEWFGLKSRFFAALVLPDRSALDLLESYGWSSVPSEAALGYAQAGLGNKNLAAGARTTELRVGGGRKVLQFDVFAGPQRTDALKELPGTSDLLSYGTGCFLSSIVNLVGPLILGALKATSALVGNYGVGIILTTLLIRLVVFPLSLKSQRSMAAMQVLGPKIQALREKYKDDQQRFGMEQMKLFREHKVNPMAGCLPMLLQMPIFIGMYSVFEQSVELRGAPFLLWMKDMSQPDHLIGPWTPFEIPLLITTLSIDALNLLPIVMTFTWFLQAYLTPRSPDPQMASQQKMMMAMPVVFGLMCYGLASGLSLYFLVNSLLGMAELKLIKKVFLPPPEPVRS